MKSAAEFAKWPSQNEEEPLYNSEADEYYVVVRTEHSNLNNKTVADFEAIIKEAKKVGVTKILNYYNKQTGSMSYLLNTGSEEQMKMESTLIDYADLAAEEATLLAKIDELTGGSS